jgi:O-antigen/teichoic acid export membrane protein
MAAIEPVSQHDAVVGSMAMATTVSHGFAFLVATLVARLTSFISSILIARAVGIEPFGSYSYALVVVALGAIAVDFGVSSVTTRDLAQSGNLRRIVGSALTIHLLFALLAVLLIKLGLDLLKFHSLTYSVTVAYSLSLIPIAIVTSLNPLLNATGRLSVVSWSTALMGIVSLAAVWMAIRLGANVINVAIANVIVNSLHAAIVWLLAWHTLRLIPLPRLEPSALARTLNDAAPFFIIAIQTVIYNRIDVLLLNQMVGESAVALYAVAYKYIEALQAVPAVLFTASFPFLSRVAMSSADELKKQTASMMRLLLFVSVPAVSFLAVAAREIIVLPFGLEYASSAAALRILVWSVLATFLNVPLTMIFHALRRTSRMVWVPTVLIVVNVLLNVLLIPRWTVAGASIATVVAEFLGLVLLVALLIRDDLLPRLDAFTNVLGKIAAASLMVVVGYLLLPNLLLQLAIAPVLYVILLVLFRAFEDEDKQLLQGLLASFRQQAPGRS